MESFKPIAIIGAGIAGLTAANFLQKKNRPLLHQGNALFE